MTPDRALELLRTAVASDDVEAHATAFYEAINGILTTLGGLDDEDRDALQKATIAAACRTAVLAPGQLSEAGWSWDRVACPTPSISKPSRPTFVP